MRRRRFARVILVVAALVGLLLPGTAALAKSYWISEADVSIIVQNDGSLLVTELITFDFSGEFTGAFRDIPLRSGESIESVTVTDNTGPYALGGCTQLGCSSPAGTYGVGSNGDDVRVVWHHESEDERRTFELSYTMIGVSTAYDDVLDVNMQVWGDQWPVGVDRLTAEVIIPGEPEQGSVYVWGHPYDLDGETSLGDNGVSPNLEAQNVPSERWVEIRTAFPVDVLTSTSGAAVVAGDGLQQIVDEENAFAQSGEVATRNAGIGLVVGLLLLLGISVGFGLFAYLRYGKVAAVDFIKSEGLLMAPAYAVSNLLADAQIGFDDIDLFEIHEAFAAQTLATLTAWESQEYCRERLGRATPLGPIDRAKLNTKGGSLAIGHPFAATGARILASLAKMLDERGTGRGLISICTAGGMGVTAIVEK
jgi:hypothetical protein